MSSLFFSCLVLSLCPSLSLSVSVCLCLCLCLSLSLSLSYSVSVWCCVLWCCVVLCGVVSLFRFFFSACDVTNTVGARRAVRQGRITATCGANPGQCPFKKLVFSLDETAEEHPEAGQAPLSTKPQLSRLHHQSRDFLATLTAESVSSAASSIAGQRGPSSPLHPGHRWVPGGIGPDTCPPRRLHRLLSVAAQIVESTSLVSSCSEVALGVVSGPPLLPRVIAGAHFRRFPLIQQRPGSASGARAGPHKSLHCRKSSRPLTTKPCFT